MHTRGKKVKKMVITCIQVVNGWMTPNSSFKRHTRVVNFEFIQYCCHLCQFFPVNIKQCSLLVCPVFWQIQLSLFDMGNICVVGLPLLDTHNIFSYFFSCFLKIFPYYFLFLLIVNKQVIFFDCWLILFEYLLQWNALK